jgi:hypothetical protein
MICELCLNKIVIKNQTHQNFELDYLDLHFTSTI